MARNEIQFQKGLSLGTFIASYGTQAQCEAALAQSKNPISTLELSRQNGVRWNSPHPMREKRQDVMAGREATRKFDGRVEMDDAVLHARVDRRAVRPYHTKLYLAEFQHRFNQSADLRAMFDHLAFIVVRAKSRTYEYLKVHTQRGNKPNE